MKRTNKMMLLSLTTSVILLTSCFNNNQEVKKEESVVKQEDNTKVLSLQKEGLALLKEFEQLKSSVETLNTALQNKVKDFKTRLESKDETSLNQTISDLKKAIEDNKKIIANEKKETNVLQEEKKPVISPITTYYRPSVKPIVSKPVVIPKPVEQTKLEQPKPEQPKPEVPKVVSKLPEAINAELTTSIDTVMNTWITNNNISGGVVLVAKDGKIVAMKAYGNQYVADFDINSKYDKPNYLIKTTPVATQVDTMYDLASVTKTMATTQAVMKLVSEKKLDLNANVSQYLPGFEANGKENVTVKSLLTHTSGLPQWLPTYFHAKNKSEQLAYLKQVSLNEKFVQDGVDNKLHHYSDLGFMTLGYIVEAITHQDLEVYVQEAIYKPLNLTNTMYNPLTKFSKDNIAATSLGNPYEYKMVDEEGYPNFGYDTTADSELFKTFTGWRKYTLRGEVNDGNAAMATNGVAGHAGLFSNVKDLAVLTQLMLNKGTYEGIQIYDSQTLELFTTKQTNTNIVSEEFGYAFKLDQSWMGDSASEKVYGHDGFTGTYYCNDPENNLTIIVLTNKMQSGFRSGLLANGNPQNSNLYWNISPMIRQISNAVRNYYNIK